MHLRVMGSSKLRLVNASSMDIAKCCMNDTRASNYFKELNHAGLPLPYPSTCYTIPRNSASCTLQMHCKTAVTRSRSSQSCDVAHRVSLQFVTHLIGRMQLCRVCVRLRAGGIA